jgi:hypothetical protein
LRDLGVKRVERKSMGLGAHDRRRTPFAKQQERQKLLDPFRLLEVKRAEFDTHDQNLGVRGRTNDMPRELKAR